MKSIQLKKLVASTIAAAALLAAASSAQAVATVSTTFNVDITLSPLCTVSTPANLAFNYTSFQPTAAVASSPFTVTCPLNTTYSVAVAGSTLDNAVNLTYNLSTTAAAETGTGAAQNFTVDGTIAPLQGGACTSVPCNNASATNKVQTLIVSY